MRHYLLLIALMGAGLLGLFALAEALEISLLTDPGPWLRHGGLPGALTGVGLLVADVALPVPSSLVMVAHGAVFGVALGAGLSVLGALGAGWVGFWVGRRGGPLLERWIPAEERERAGRMLDRWGGLAVVVSRPVPILAETVAVLAGTSALGWTEMTLATVLGSLPAAVLFALAGAAAAHFLGSFLLVLLGVLLVATPVWLALRGLRDRAAGGRSAGMRADAGP